MSSARSAHPRPGSARLILIGAIAEEQRRDRAQGAATWRDPAEVGRSLGLSRGATLAQVNRAEALGLVDHKEIASGERVALTDLGWKLFGLDDRKRRGAVPILPDVPDRSPLVQLLIHWPAATALAEELADHLGLDVEAFWEEVLAAEQLGEVETWPDHPAGPAVMLSTLAANRIGLALSSDGTRWLRPHDADPTSIDPAWQVVTEASLAEDPEQDSLLERLVDPAALEGWEMAGKVETGERALEDLLGRWSDPDGEPLLVLDRERTVEDAWHANGRSIVVLPWPLLLLDERLTWPVGERASDGLCPGCHDAPLGVRTYCLVCCRSGLDDVIREILQYEAKPGRIRQDQPEERPKA